MIYTTIVGGLSQYRFIRIENTKNIIVRSHVLTQMATAIPRQHTRTRQTVFPTADEEGRRKLILIRGLTGKMHIMVYKRANL